METNILFIIFLWVVFPAINTLDQASFYGGSYIAVPLKEARSSTDIHFKFRTYLPHALLLLVAGKTDYCIVRLDGGRLKVNINLGSGEAELHSQHDLALNDFRWHDVFIVRKEADLSMIIDNSYSKRTHLPGNFFELNVHFGLFIGGIGNYTDLFFGHTDNFRGCLAEVMYNGLLVLDQARRRQSQATVHGVTWNCASEFDAAPDRPVSFVEDGAFLAMAQPISHTVRVQVELKTSSRAGVLFYNTGPPSKSDYFCVEILDGRIRVVTRDGDRTIENVGDEFVSDGRWHKVSVRVNSNGVELNGKVVRVPRGYYVDFSDVYYVGGIEASKRARAMTKGLKTSDISFKGCLKHITLGEKVKGLTDVRISEGLLPGCVWQYPCLRNPCHETSVCNQQGLDSFRCVCQGSECQERGNASDHSKVLSHPSFATELELLALETLEVVEGSTVLITGNNLHVILDYPKFGIKDSGIKFRVAEPPEHGNVVADVWPHNGTFNLADVARDKVYYVHDGSETQTDHVTLEIEFHAGSLYILPAYLQGTFKFTLSVNVAPVNDPPELKITPSHVLRIAQGTKKIFEGELLQVADPDSSAEHLVFKIVDAGPGYFEYTHKGGQPIASFTQRDLDEKRVIYAHRPTASNESYITIRVSDGVETSKPERLRVSAFAQNWRLQNNTGVVLVHSTSVTITPFNLSFVSNVVDAVDAAQFHIEQGPQFGVVEVERTVGVWESSVIFTNDDLKQRRVRYRHVTSQPEHDEFQFRTTLNMSMLYTFRMTFAKCHLYAYRHSEVLLNDTTETSLTLDHLQYQTDPVESTGSSIIYEIVEPPLFGYLFSSVSKYQLRRFDRFTQDEINLSNVKFRLYRKGYSRIVDRVVYNVIAPGCRNLTENLTFVYVPTETTLRSVTVIVKRLQVEEGRFALLDSTYLFVKSNSVSDLLFNVTVEPQHGVVQVGDTNERKQTSVFTLNELENGKVFYSHDDSESRVDKFQFMAVSSETENFLYVDWFHVDVILKNDNSPSRAINKIFHVVVGGEKLLTSNDLSYKDTDLDTKPTDIIYTFRDLPNGEFYNATNPSSRLYNFTQADLIEGNVLFKHRGYEYGKVKFWVTDGPYYVTDVLEIHASAPFVRTEMNKRLIVQHGKSRTVTSDNLNYDTNVHTKEDEVFYEITTKPVYGKFTHGNSVVRKFTQADINAGLISYQNEVTTNGVDEIGLKVKCKDATSVAQMSVWMLPASYWDPLKVKTARTLSVEESTSAVIDKSILEIVQAEVPPGAITYHVIETPENGYLSILPTGQTADEQSMNVRTFTQALINDKRVIYIQSVANETRDRVLFNVTNGMVWLHGLTLDLQIIPERLYLGSTTLTVDEGGTGVITSTNLFVLTEYYRTKVTDYVVLENPRHGCILVHKRCNKLHGFSHKEFTAGLVQYGHDGTENLTDSVVLIAVTGQKRSIPTHLKIRVVPVNDQTPTLVNNTGLTVWEGGTAGITSAMLGAYDADRPEDILKYHVLDCRNGVVALRSDNRTKIQYFTQEIIDKGLIVFTHLNGTEGKFTFNVSDGLHSSEVYTFHVKTRPVRLTLVIKPLHIFPLQRKYLTPVHLLGTISDPERDVVFEVAQVPKLGRLMMESTKAAGIFNVVAGFTQRDLNESKVFYEHIQPFAGLYANDSFVFNVKASFAETLSNQKMKIDISVSSGGLDAYVAIPRMVVDEGGITNVKLNLSGVVSFLEAHAGLRSPVIHAAASTRPQHGEVFVPQHPNVTTFTQHQLELGRVQYQHDHSDSLGDNIYFSLYLLPGYILLCNVTVPVIVNPINDQPFKLVTPAPHLKVIQGQNHTISKEELCTEDADTSPDQLSYDIISGPDEGRIVLLPEGIPISHFTQADINGNRLVYIHNSSVLTDTFHLRVWDGKFRPDYTVFNVKVLPISLNVSGGLPLYIQQGMNVVLLSVQQFSIDTNADLYKLVYRVVELPRHGMIYVKEDPSDKFHQDDLIHNRVMYMQRDMTTANDSLKVHVGITYGNVSMGKEVDVRVQVQPLMQIGNCTLLSGEVNKLGLHVIDATALAKLTNSNPKYTVVKQPVYGHVRKIIRSSGEHRNVLDVPVSSFTHEEVQSGLIHIAVDAIEVNWRSGTPDRLRFLLAASIFQPAVADLNILIKSSLHNSIYSTLPGPNDPAGHEGGMHFASPNMTRDYFLIVSMVSGVVILGVAVIIVIKCRSFEPDELNKDEQCLQPLPLPRPPDRLMTSPSVKHPDGYGSPVTAALPHCKVTPLNRPAGGGGGGGDDSSARYPYGADEHGDDWSSCDVSDPTCPSRNNIMLRRNQYWV